MYLFHKSSTQVCSSDRCKQFIIQTNKYTHTHTQTHIYIYVCVCDLCIHIKAVSLQARNGPNGSRKLRLQDFVTTAQDGGKVFNLKHRPTLLPGNKSGANFCWRLSGRQDHSATGRITEKFQPRYRESNPRPAGL